MNSEIEIRGLWRLLSVAGVVDVIVYGSAVEGIADEMSDFDVLIIVRDEGVSAQDVGAIMEALFSIHGVEISIYSAEFVSREFLRGNPFFGYCIEWGKSLLGSEFVRDLRGRFRPTEYTSRCEAAAVAFNVCRAAAELREDNAEEVVRRLSHAARYALVLHALRKFGVFVVLLDDIASLLRGEGCREAVSLIRKRAGYLKDAERFAVELLGCLRTCTEVDYLSLWSAANRSEGRDCFLAIYNGLAEAYDLAESVSETR